MHVFAPLPAPPLTLMPHATAASMALTNDSFTALFNKPVLASLYSFQCLYTTTLINVPFSPYRHMLRSYSSLSQAFGHKFYSALLADLYTSTCSLHIICRNLMMLFIPPVFKNMQLWYILLLRSNAKSARKLLRSRKTRLTSTSHTQLDVGGSELYHAQLFTERANAARLSPGRFR